MRVDESPSHHQCGLRGKAPAHPAWAADTLRSAASNYPCLPFPLLFGIKGARRCELEEEKVNS